MKKLASALFAIVFLVGIFALPASALSMDTSIKGDVETSICNHCGEKQVILADDVDSPWITVGYTNCGFFDPRYNDTMQECYNIQTYICNSCKWGYSTQSTKEQTVHKHPPAAWEAVARWL